MKRKFLLKFLTFLSLLHLNLVVSSLPPSPSVSFGDSYLLPREKSNERRTQSESMKGFKVRTHKSDIGAGLGSVFVNKNAQTAYKRNKLNSMMNYSNSRIRVIFVNQTKSPLILCW